MGSSVIFTVAFRAKADVQLSLRWENKTVHLHDRYSRAKNIDEGRQIMGFRWFNIIGALMLLFALFLNEVVYLNVWYDFNFYVIIPAILYLGVGIWLSLWGGTRRQEA